MTSILFVDDDPQLAVLIPTYLRRLGYSIHSVCDGAAALELLASQPFDLLITDLHLPRLSGAELMLHLLKLPQRPPILLCTGQADDRHARSLADRVLQKPFRLAELLAAVSALLPSAPVATFTPIEGLARRNA